eukprot:COSAG05_NODE_115_length_18028_cov_137.264767_2_plen_49_part_00
MDATEFVSWLFAKPRPGQGSIALVKRLFIQVHTDLFEVRLGSLETMHD